MNKRRFYEILSLILTLGTLFTALSLFSYNEKDPSYSNIVFDRFGDKIHNIFGKVGAYTADFLGTAIGLSAVLIPFFLFATLVIMLRVHRGKESNLRLFGAILSWIIFMLSISLLSALISSNDLFFTDKSAGGIVGVTGAKFMSSVLGKIGSIILVSIMLILSFMGILNISLTDMAKALSGKGKGKEKKDSALKSFLILIKKLFIILGDKWRRRKIEIKLKKEAARLRKDTEKEEKRHFEQEKLRLEEEKKTQKALEEKSTENVVLENVKVGKTPPPLLNPENIQTFESDNQSLEDSLGIQIPEGEELLTVSRLEELLKEQEQRESMSKKIYEENINEDEEEFNELENMIPVVQQFDFSVPPAKNIKNFTTAKHYSLPFELLNEPDESVFEADTVELQEKADLLLSKLRDFGVDGQINEIRPGPVVTMFEFEPAPGIKINKIANLENDLALAMSALSIRIIAPIPGKGAVGIEIPNPERSMVSLRELLESKEFKQADSPLSVALGKDTTGKPFFTDLRKMPHLLIAGTTGSGKSVCVNTIICSIVYKSSPEHVKFVMIDPKMVELSVYEGIPHLAAPVVTDPRQASVVLQNAVKEMEGRYATLASCRVRSMESYNEFISNNPNLLDKDGNPLESMPYMVIIVDEFADLMMVAGKDVENSIIRIAQMARAVGIHLVLATQRPSVNVITGIIKANMPARISFKVSSKIDSRTIIDQNGAEMLLGRGDSLFIPPGTSELVRIHGCFVSEAEVLRVADELKKYGEPDYNLALLADKNSESDNFDDEELDSRYDEALKIVKEKGFASISMIQRYLRIGYNRAARIVETMERQGLIAQSDGTSKPRDYIGD